MIDLLPQINTLLSPLGARIETSYNSVSTDLPLIILTEIDNSTNSAPDGVELFSNIIIQVDVYHLRIKSAKKLAAAISAVLTATGFHRDGGAEMPEDNLKRYTMTFSTLADEIGHRLYSGANI